MYAWVASLGVVKEEVGVGQAASGEGRRNRRDRATRGKREN